MTIIIGDKLIVVVAAWCFTPSQPVQLRQGERDVEKGLISLIIIMGDSNNW